MPRTSQLIQAAPVPLKTWEERYAERNAEVAATLDLIGLDDAERAFLATCQKIYRRDTGCNSPFEEFFTMLVGSIESGYWPDPDHVEHELESFRQNWDDMKRDASRFMEAYPEKETTHA